VEVAEGYFMPLFPLSALKSLNSLHEQAEKLSAPVSHDLHKCLIMTCAKVSSYTLGMSHLKILELLKNVANSGDNT
jgi:hypothetical protein